MSYEIVYAREFLKTKDGRIIPLVLMGSNNSWTKTYSGRKSRAKDWTILLSKDGENPAMKFDELLKRVGEKIPSKYQEHFVRNGNWVDDASFVRFFENGIKKAKTMEELNAELLVKVQLYGEVYYYEKKFDPVLLYSENIRSSEDLDGFLLKAEEIVNENKEEHKCFIDLTFNEGYALERPRKQRVKKEPLQHRFFIIKTHTGYVSKLVAGRLYSTYTAENAKQFKRRKDAERWMRDRDLERRFQRQTFEIEYVV